MFDLFIIVNTIGRYFFTLYQTKFQLPTENASRISFLLSFQDFIFLTGYILGIQQHKVRFTFPSSCLGIHLPVLKIEYIQVHNTHTTVQLTNSSYSMAYISVPPYNRYLKAFEHIFNGIFSMLVFRVHNRYPFLSQIIVSADSCFRIAPIYGIGPPPKVRYLHDFRHIFKLWNFLMDGIRNSQQVPYSFHDSDQSRSTF